MKENGWDSRARRRLQYTTYDYRQVIPIFWHIRHLIGKLAVLLQQLTSLCDI
jgi:hypothetical protein